MSKEENQPADLTPHLRRQRLLTSSAPPKTQEYLVTLKGRMKNVALRDVDITVRFVPDRSVIGLENFITYLAFLGGIDFSTLEELATAIRDDLANALLAKWTEVMAIKVNNENSLESHHMVVVEDRQPQWHNKLIIDRLGPL